MPSFINKNPADPVGQKTKIEMTITDPENFLSDYWASEPVINSEAANFLDNAIRGIHARNYRSLFLEISADSLTSGQKQLFGNAIHNSYQNRLISEKHNMVNNTRSSVLLFVIGTVILLVMFLLENDGLQQWPAEILDIIGWVFVWEAVDEFWLERSKIRLRYHRWRVLSHIPVKFTGLSAAGRLVLIAQEEERKQYEKENG